jgi:hypothetical protein
MNAKPALGLVIALAATISVRGDDLPVRLNFDRYKAMVEHSPFAVATVVVPQAAAPDFAKDLYVANAAKLPEGDMITIASTSDRDFKKYLTAKSPVDGYAIVRVRWSRKVGATKVTISKDGQLATLTFNQMLSAQPVPNRLPMITPPAFPRQSGFPRPVGLSTPTPPIR